MKNKMAVLLILLSFMFSFSAYADNVNKATPSEAVKKPVHTIEVDSFCYDPDFELEYLDETGNIAYRSFYGNDGTYYLYLPIGTDISSIQPVCSMEIKDASGCEFYEDDSGVKSIA